MVLERISPIFAHGLHQAMLVAAAGGILAAICTFALYRQSRADEAKAGAGKPNPAGAVNAES
ncbi:hypothetical protein K0U00_48250, partial [Paenibacillus sepulcri]|nr:hypothetical protein [Paenibacillus sepulcri]